MTTAAEIESIVAPYRAITNEAIEVAARNLADLKAALAEIDRLKVLLARCKPATTTQNRQPSLGELSITCKHGHINQYQCHLCYPNLAPDLTNAGP